MFSLIKKRITRDECVTDINLFFNNVYLLICIYCMLQTFIELVCSVILSCVTMENPHLDVLRTKANTLVSTQLLSKDDTKHVA